MPARVLAGPPAPLLAVIIFSHIPPPMPARVPAYHVSPDRQHPCWQSLSFPTSRPRCRQGCRRTMSYRTASTPAGSLVLSHIPPDAGKGAGDPCLTGPPAPLLAVLSFPTSHRCRQGCRRTMSYRTASTPAGSHYLFPHPTDAGKGAGVPCLTGPPAPLLAVIIFSPSRPMPARVPAVHGRSPPNSRTLALPNFRTSQNFPLRRGYCVYLSGFVQKRSGGKQYIYCSSVFCYPLHLIRFQDI